MSRHKIDIFLLRALFKFWFHLKPEPTGYDRPSIRSILVVNTTAIGDTLMSTPAVRAIRSAYPDSRIVAMVSPAARAVLADNPHLDDLVDHRGRVDVGYLLNLPQLLRRLRSENFDMVIVLHGNDPDIAPLAYLTGAKVRMGWKTSRLGFLFTHPVDMKVRNVHQIDVRLNNLKSIGIQSKGRHMELQVPGKERERVDKWLKERRISQNAIFAIHPFANDTLRAWSVDQAAVFGRLCLQDLAQTVVVLGGKKESSAADLLAEKIGKDAFSVAGQLSITESAALIGRCHLMVTADTGPMHIAQVMNVPTVVVLGGSNWKETGPINQPSLGIRENGTSDRRLPARSISGRFVFERTRDFWAQLDKDTRLGNGQ